MPRPSDQGIRLRPRGHTDNPISSHSHIAAEIGKEIMDFTLRSIPFIFRRDLYHAVKSYEMGPTALLPLRRKKYCGFLWPLKVHCPRTGLNPRTSGPMASTLATRSWRTVKMVMSFLWVVTPCRLVGAYYLPQPFSAEDGRQYVSPKRWYLYGVTIRKKQHRQYVHN
jgi:hypothetical protein